MLTTSSLLGDFLVLFLTSSVALICYCKWKLQYWSRRGVPSPPTQIQFGNIDRIRGEHIGVQLQSIYEEMKMKKWKHGGVYSYLVPFYVPVDLEYVRHILTKDFHSFADRGIYYNEEVSPLSAHLFNLEATKWKNMRSKLTPTFSSGKMKMMFHTLVECEANLHKKMLQEVEKKQPIDVKDILGCFTTDIIGSCAFGLDCNTFENENSLFRVFGRQVFIRTVSQQVKQTFATIFPKLAKTLKVSSMRKDVSDFYLKIVKDTIGYRERNNVVRKDFLQLLMDMKNNDNAGLTMKEAAAQSFVFFVAGFETSSTTMSFALYELARNQDIQDKVRDEIRTVLAKYDGEITYEAVQDMKLLGQVIDETLRMYPPGSVLLRQCNSDYQIPNTGVWLQKGTRVFVSVLGIHYDEEYYPDPEKFDPERFNEENKSRRHNYAYLPFGEGPRNCIGMRFGLMQTKVGLVSVLRNIKFTVSTKTKEPLKMNRHSTVLAAVGEIWLDAQKV